MAGEQDSDGENQYALPQRGPLLLKGREGNKAPTCRSLKYHKNVTPLRTRGTIERDEMLNTTVFVKS